LQFPNLSNLALLSSSVEQAEGGTGLSKCGYQQPAGRQLFWGENAQLLLPLCINARLAICHGFRSHKALLFLVGSREESKRTQIV